MAVSHLPLEAIQLTARLTDQHKEQWGPKGQAQEYAGH